MIFLDTTIIIDIRRGRSEGKEVLDKYKDKICGISAITVQELYVGLGYTLEKMGKAIYEQNLNQIQRLLEDYEIIDITRPILEQAGFLKGQLMAKGITIEIQDLIIGVTAEIFKAELIITRNPNHFKPFKIPIESYEII